MTITVRYTSQSKGHGCTLEIDSRHGWSKVADVVVRRLFPDAKHDAPDPVFDAIMKRRESERRSARAAAKGEKS